MIEHEQKFDGVTPEYYREEAKTAGPEAVYGPRAEELQHWYDWIKEHDLEPLGFGEAVKVYQQARAQAKKEYAKANPGAFDELADGLKEMPEGEAKWEQVARILWDYDDAIEKMQHEILERWDCFMWPYVWTGDLHPEDFRPIDVLKEPSLHFKGPLEAWAICKIKEGAARPPRYPRLGESPETEASFTDFLRALSMKPAQTVDRAARGPKGWSHPSGEPPRYADPRNSHIIEYYTENTSLQALRESVEKLNPRTADVWRLVTAACLEAWQDGQPEPSAVWIDARQLCDAMSYKRHHKGGYKREHVLEAVRALKDLKNFKITVPLGAETYPVDPRTGKRRATKVEARRTYEVVIVAATDEVREMFTGEWYPLRWLIRPGEWIKNYPKQFAPLYRALVELPAQKTAHVWAKAIGTELTWQYRENGDKPKTLKVKTLLEQADLLADLQNDRRARGRARDYLEEALNILKGEGICKSWEYHPKDFDDVEEAGYRGWFEPWLESRVIVTPPDQIAGAIGKVKAQASVHKERALKRKSQAKGRSPKRTN